MDPFSPDFDPNQPDRVPSLLADLDDMLGILIARATGGAPKEWEYRELRERLLASRIGTRLPEFVRRFRTVGQFWDFIKRKFETYRERTDFLHEQFDPLILEEEKGPSPVDSTATPILETIDSEYIRRAWTKALERRATDPDGAITAARTLLESVCKHVLDDFGEPYDDKADLPQLYGATAKRLNLAPSQHAEADFKRILGGCFSVIEGLGGLRNRLSDAHGQGKKNFRAAPRHAELAVNLAGAMAAFIFATAKERENESKPSGSAE